MAKIFSKIKTSLAKSTTQLLKNLCFISLVVMLVLVVATSDKWWWISLILSVSLVTSFLLKSLVIKKYTVKILFYCIDFVALVFLTGTIGKTYLSTLYSLILVDFYLNNTIKSNTIMALCSYVSYCACLFLNMYFINETLFSNVSEVISIAVTDLIVFVLIYFFVIMLMAILKRNKKIEESLLIIAEREVRLQEAYKSLEETSKLEERNRIAKQIHDTTGHSITTIIMQTEAAKLVIDTNPEDAKSKIISANLQAVEALKELR